MLRAIRGPSGRTALAELPAAAITAAASERIGTAVGVSSMTGFAGAAGEAEGISWIWELKSVNGRTLDLRLRLGPGFDGLEPRLRAGLAERCRRGNVSANLTVNRTQPPAVRVNREML